MNDQWELWWEGRWEESLVLTRYISTSDVGIKLTSWISSSSVNLNFKALSCASNVLTCSKDKFLLALRFIYCWICKWTSRKNTIIITKMESTFIHLVLQRDSRLQIDRIFPPIVTLCFSFFDEVKHLVIRQQTIVGGFNLHFLCSKERPVLFL